MREFLLGDQPGENMPATGHCAGRAEEILRPADSHEFLVRIIEAAVEPWSDDLAVRSKMIIRAGASPAPHRPPPQSQWPNKAFHLVPV